MMKNRNNKVALQLPGWVQPLHMIVEWNCGNNVALLLNRTAMTPLSCLLYQDSCFWSHSTNNPNCWSLVISFDTHIVMKRSLLCNFRYPRDKPKFFCAAPQKTFYLSFIQVWVPIIILIYILILFIILILIIIYIVIIHVCLADGFKLELGQCTLGSLTDKKFIN